MKTATKLKIAALSLLCIGVTLIILGTVVFKDESFPGGAPNFAFLMPGLFTAFFSIPLFFLGFLPNIAKMNAKLHNESLDIAGEEMKTAISRSADVAGPGVTKIAKSVKEGFAGPTVFCRKCGKEITADSDFCKFCGAKQD